MLPSVSVPLLTLSVTSIGPALVLMLRSRFTLSGSAMLMPASASGCDSAVLRAPDTVITGASFTGMMVMLNTPVGSLPPPESDTVKWKESVVPSSPSCW